MNKKKYTSDVPRKMDTLTNGKIRCYFDEELVPKEDIIPAAEEGGEPQTVTRQEYAYDAVDMEPGFSRGDLIDALIRNRDAHKTETDPETGEEVDVVFHYTQSAVEAIMRHKIAGTAGAAADFRAFNTFAEECKVEADRILSVDNN